MCVVESHYAGSLSLYRLVFAVCILLLLNYTRREKEFVYLRVKDRVTRLSLHVLINVPRLSNILIQHSLLNGKISYQLLLRKKNSINN